MHHCWNWQLCTSWEPHTDKLNIQHYPPPPSPWHASVAASIGTAVQLSPQPASQPLSKATSVETERTRAACRSLLVPKDRGSVSSLLAAHYHWPHQPYRWVLIERYLLLCHLNKLCEASNCNILSPTYSDLLLKRFILLQQFLKTKHVTVRPPPKNTPHYRIH